MSQVDRILDLDLCAGCRAYLLEDSDEDPRNPEVRINPPPTGTYDPEGTVMEVSDLQPGQTGRVVAVYDLSGPSIAEQFGDAVEALEGELIRELSGYLWRNTAESAPPLTQERMHEVYRAVAEREATYEERLRARARGMGAEAVLRARIYYAWRSNEPLYVTYAELHTLQMMPRPSPGSPMPFNSIDVVVDAGQAAAQQRVALIQ